MANETGAKVPCMSGILDLQEICQQNGLRFSLETNRYLLLQILQKMRPECAQKLISKLVDRGDVKWSDDEEEYEVEDIFDHIDDEGTTFYLIKWKGWSAAHNTWEPANNLDCQKIIQDYRERLKNRPSKRKITTVVEEEDNKTFKRRTVEYIFQKLISSPATKNITPRELIALTSPQFIKSFTASGLERSRSLRARSAHCLQMNLNPKSKRYKIKKNAIAKELEEWEQKLNNISIDPAKIFVENQVDLEGPPQDFEFITDYKEGEGISIPQDPMIGCECTDCYDTRKQCCPSGCGTDFAYYKNKRVRVQKGTPIYECNKRCKCGPECSNRVVQNGCRYRLCIFRTANGRGWGVKTLDKIKKGNFVVEYVGEVITAEEAERRGQVYDAEGMTYLFDLDYNDDDCPFTVDAGYYGNVSHFINHSCDPNLEVFAVWINTLDPRLPRISLFAKKDIQKGEELTFDYMMTGDTTQKSMLSTSTMSLDDLSTNLNTTEIPSSGISSQDGSDSGIGSLMDGSNNQDAIHNLPKPLQFVTDEESGVKSPKADYNKNWKDSLSTPKTQGSAISNTVPTPPSSDKKGKMRHLSSQKNRIACQCGAANCRKFLF